MKGMSDYMKRIVSVMMIVFTFFMLVSCGAEPKKEPPKMQEKIIGSETYHGAIEMPSRILFVRFGGMWYYSKADGASEKFCFDPLCSHSVQETTCIYRLFNPSPKAGIVEYSKKENRVYMARGQKIYSTSFDASDLRLDCSLGEIGDIQERESGSYIRWMRCTDNYLFFLYKNDKTGHTQLMRYDTSKRKLEAISSENEWIIGYEPTDTYIFAKILTENNELQYVTTDFDFENRHIVNNPIDPSSSGVSMGVFDGKYFYGRIPEGLFALDPLTDEKKLISDDPIIDGSQVLAVHNGYIYFTSTESKVVGKKYDARLDDYRDVEVIECKLYRASQNGEISLALDFISPIETLNFVDGGAVIYTGSIYDANGNNMNSQRGPISIYFDLDESGNLINPKIVGNCADDAELIECLKVLS